ALARSSIRKILCNSFARSILSALILFLATGLAAAQPTVNEADSPAAERLPLTDAERIAGLQKLLAADQSWQTTLEAELTRLDEQFAEASTAFTQLDTEMTSAQADLTAATSPEQRAE